MIVFKITYDTSVVADFAPTFNSGWGYDYTTKTSTSGTLKTVTYESDTVFTAISIPNNNRNCVKSIYIDASGMTNLYGTFTSCQSMTDFTIVNATSKLTNLYQITYDCTILANITYENCDLSSVTNIQNVFNNGARDVVTNATFKNVKFNDTTKSMISILGKATTMVVEDCDFSSITSCYSLFGGCVGLKGTFDLSMYDFTNVYETNAMFNGCTNLTKIIMPKGTFDKLTNCSGMFQDCTSLTEIDLSGFHIPNAQNISYMFGGCVLIEEIDLSVLGVLNPTNINHMFISCQKLKRVNLSGIKIPKAMSFSHMFYDSAVIEWIDISNVIAQASDVTNFWRSGAVVNDIGMLYCPADVINSFAKNMVSSGRTCNIYYHDAKLEDLTVDSRFNYIYCEEYHGDVVTTPDDLKLHGLSDVQDTLDLTTGTYTQRVKKWNLAEEGYTFIKAITSQEAQGYVRFDFRQPQLSSFGNPDCISKNATHINNLGLPNLTEGVCTNTLGRCLGVAANNAFLMLKLKTTDVTSYDKAGLDEWIKANNFTIYYNAVFSGIDSSIKTETYQVNINPLKSYYNGSIQTSSQQLAPTLKTTLPVSNKFTTTNLTSGLTYNVYFDGTATKLDAGGTIITNPISPCEVECGGTTLTIEGTDIQNVRVLETTVSNEVGSVNGTTDVELSKVKTKCELYNYFDDYFQGSHNTDWARDYNCTSTRDDTTVKIVGKGSFNYAGYSLVESLPFGTYKLHYKVKVSTIGDKYKVALSSNPNGTPQDAYVPVTDVTSTALVEEQTFVFYKKHITNMLFYTYTNGQEIEYYDISLIKLSDEDITGTDTSSINYSQVISDLEQPIKLRSLGTTYDSYNLVTGELIKRIGVSETDGSYSVLSRPIVSKVEKPCSFMSNLATSDQLLVYNGATKSGDVITLNKETKWSLVQLTGSCTRMEKGKQYMCILHDIVGDMTDVVFFRQQDTTTEILPMENNRVVFTAMSNASNRWCFIQQNNGMSGGGTVSFKVSIIEYFEGAEKLDIPYFNTYEQRDLTLQLLPPTCPHLYTNGQVKVYSESDVYPTTILNGHSTNNYEINELNTSNNYTIRYEGECESINLANKSNEQGTNRIVKTSTNGSGYLTFVNGVNINNVLLTQGDVREQEINHFNGLQTVEINQLLISSKRNLFESYMKNDFDTDTVTNYESHYSSLHNGVFKCGSRVNWNNSQLGWCLAKPEGGGFYNYGVNNANALEDKPIMLGGKQYHISCNITINDNETSQTYAITFYGKDGAIIGRTNAHELQLATGTSTHTEKHINTLTVPNADVYAIALWADYGGLWIFDCTITDFTICEPEYAKPNVPLVYEHIDLPQPVQLNSLPDGTCDTYNPITGEYVQNVGYLIYDDTTTWKMYDKDFYYTDGFDHNGKFIIYHKNLKMKTSTQLWNGNSGFVVGGLNAVRVVGLQSKDEFLEYMKQYPLQIIYGRKEPITTQLTPITIPTFEGGILQLITTDGKVFPMIEYSMPTNNRYDTSSWETGVVYTQRNMTEVYFNDSTTPMIPIETTTLTTDHISSGSIILNDNGNGLIVLKGNYTGRDIPYFTGMRSVEAIEVETTPSPDQPLFGKGGRK